ncbi:MAG TPA: SUMF1/EgtB/PvdO family nonheme iron enzyme [Xanthomonadaceae bacterium]|nr:SUMF1/EgtB/PvdO family nonheme iron enzyme [Xanthomonadaceae bacterium]
MRAIGWFAVGLALLAACSRSGDEPVPSAAREAPLAPSITISGDDRLARNLSWSPPQVERDGASAAALLARAEAALAAGRLYDDGAAAIPLYLAIAADAPDDPRARAGLQRSLAALLARGEAALDAFASSQPTALRQAQEIAAVARGVDPGAAAVQAYLARADRAERVRDHLEAGARALQHRDVLKTPVGSARAIAEYRAALALQPGHADAMQGLAAVESLLIGRAEALADDNDFAAAETWLQAAAALRPGQGTVADARRRLAQLRAARIRSLRDAGLQSLQAAGGLTAARLQLERILRMALPGDPAAAELRERIELTARYGLFRPGQAFTDPLQAGARGPQMVVLPHGAFRMGATDTEFNASDAERPARYVRFERGFAMARHEVSAGEFRRFVEATAHRSRAARRGHSITYDERSGGLMKRSGVDWRHDYVGSPAGDALPVLHVSAQDAEEYVRWLSRESGERYRLPSEAEFEYALRAGHQDRYPWGDGAPPAGAGNITGAGDVSPSGRRWRNAFPAYRDGYWGPAPVGRDRASAFGLHDLAGNVSEWVADCWHEGYRRAPLDGRAWINPGCRTRVVRGGSWASAPALTRSAWRSPAQADLTNARTGFRVVREL